MNGKKEYKIFQKKRFQILSTKWKVEKNFDTDDMLYEMRNNYSISTGLIFLTATVQDTFTL